MRWGNIGGSRRGGWERGYIEKGDDEMWMLGNENTKEGEVCNSMSRFRRDKLERYEGSLSNIHITGLVIRDVHCTVYISGLTHNLCKL